MLYGVCTETSFLWSECRPRFRRLAEHWIHFQTVFLCDSNYLGNCLLCSNFESSQDKLHLYFRDRPLLSNDLHLALQSNSIDECDFDDLYARSDNCVCFLLALPRQHQDPNRHSVDFVSIWYHVQSIQLLTANDKDGNYKSFGIDNYCAFRVSQIQALFLGRCDYFC